MALRKYRGGATGAGALGKAFYKGGFEPRMNRREAALILQLKYGTKSTFYESLLTHVSTVTECSRRRRFGNIIDN